MKRLLFIFLIQSLFFSCDLISTKYIHINPKDEIGKKIEDVNRDMAVSTFGFNENEEISYHVLAFLFGNKILVYVYDNEKYIIDCYYTKLVNYDKVKNINLGKHYTDIIKKLGKPVFISYYPHPYDSGFSYWYLQKISYYINEQKYYNFSAYEVIFYFTSNDGKLIDIIEFNPHNP